MDSVAGVVIALGVLSGIFILLGKQFTFLAGQEERLSFQWLLGFAVFLLIFAVIEIPLERLEVAFHVVLYVSVAVYAVIIAGCAALCLKKKQYAGWAWKKPDAMTIALIVLVVLQVAYGMHNAIYASHLDAAYYNGITMNAIYTDTINAYDPYTGWEQAVSRQTDCWPILVAVLAEMFHMHPLVMINRVAAILEIVAFSLSVYEIVMRLTGNRKEIAVWTVGFAAFMSLYSWVPAAEDVLWTRLAESKSMLANMFVPMTLLGLIMIAKGREQRYPWILLAIFCVVGAAMSMSGVFVVTVMAGIGLLPIVLYQPKLKYAGYMALCLLPCMLVSVIQFFL